jgi:hypothetical protein
LFGNSPEVKYPFDSKNAINPWSLIEEVELKVTMTDEPQETTVGGVL